MKAKIEKTPSGQWFIRIGDWTSVFFATKARATRIARAHRAGFDIRKMSAYEVSSCYHEHLFGTESGKPSEKFLATPRWK